MIVFQSVTKHFGDDNPPALENVSFAIDRGELVVITGHSGSGKTTLMRLLTQEYLPSEGDIIFEDQPLSEMRPSDVHHHRRRIGVIFQDYKLLPELNIWENIALPLNIVGKAEAEIEQRVTDLLRLVDLESKAFLFPSQLSGGEAQRVSIARALATGPGVIFADEPTGNLDTDTTHSIAKLLQKIHQLGTTVMLTTHDVSVLDILKGERVLTLEKGKLIKDTKSKSHRNTSHHPPASAPVEQPSAIPAESDAAASDTPESVTLAKKHIRLPKFSLPFGKKKAPAAVDEVATQPDDEPEVTVEKL